MPDKTKIKRQIVGARIRNTGELELMGTIEDNGQAPVTCPLVGLLNQLQDSSASSEVLHKFIDLGIVRRISGPLIYEFTEMSGPCPYTQTQQTEGKQHG